VVTEAKDLQAAAVIPSMTFFPQLTNLPNNYSIISWNESTISHLQSTYWQN